VSSSSFGGAGLSSLAGNGPVAQSEFLLWPSSQLSERPGLIIETALPEVQCLSPVGHAPDVSSLLRLFFHSSHHFLKWSPSSGIFSGEMVKSVGFRIWDFGKGRAEMIHNNDLQTKVRKSKSLIQPLHIFIFWRVVKNRRRRQGRPSTVKPSTCLTDRVSAQHTGLHCLLLSSGQLLT
jgi:hypothetical protein